MSACSVFYRLGEADGASRAGKSDATTTGKTPAVAAATEQPMRKPGKEAVPKAEILAALEECAQPDGLGIAGAHSAASSATISRASIYAITATGNSATW